MHIVTCQLSGQKAFRASAQRLGERRGAAAVAQQAAGAQAPGAIPGAWAR